MENLQMQRKQKKTKNQLQMLKKVMKKALQVLPSNKIFFIKMSFIINKTVNSQFLTKISFNSCSRIYTLDFIAQLLFSGAQDSIVRKLFGADNESHLVCRVCNLATVRNSSSFVLDLCYPSDNG